MESLSAKLNELENAWNEFSMGILESDLVKAGVDILTTFLKVINKATSAFDGLGGSIMKILTVIAMFDLAKLLFAKIKRPIEKTLVDIVPFARAKGEETGRAYAEGMKAGIEGDKANAPEAEGQEKAKTFIGKIT
jgi:chemotaxis regulatin CheY-phosphate phosphatase CheZ